MRAATEVALGQGYVSDAVAICSLQGRFYANYCNGSASRTNYFACIFEAKVTRSDFLTTFGSQKSNRTNRHEPIGSLHWCVTPSKLVERQEVPYWWGLLEQCGGGGLREIKRPKLNTLAAADFDRIAHRLIWPLQAARNPFVCERCGRWLFSRFCNRCTIKRIEGKPEAFIGNKKDLDLTTGVGKPSAAARQKDKSPRGA
jgi:hypothetical protein